MSYLRDILKCHAPDLHAALEKAWKVVTHDVFPVLSSNDESLNSLPHSQNIENYLNNIYGSLGDVCDNVSPHFISPYELFCLHMAILFHDIGRILSEKGHGTFSKMYIKKNYEKFSIPSPELADIIGDICDYHKSLNSNFVPNMIILDSDLGKIRTRELAELLILVDEMDTTYRRLKKLYILDQLRYITGKAIFRNYIRGVSFNHSTKCIIVSLNDKLENDTEGKIDIDSLDIKPQGSPLQLADETFHRDILKLFTSQQLASTKEKSTIWDLYDKILKGELFVELKSNQKLVNELESKITSEIGIVKGNQKKLEFLESLEKVKSNQYKMALFYLYKSYFDEISDPFFRDIESEAKIKWPLLIVLPSIFNAIRISQKKTNNLKFLNRLGIHSKKWLICYKEHLYDCNGKETIEPVLDFPFLEKVVKKMWAMSSNTFGDSWFSFTDLASKVHKKDIELLVLAVQRIEIITRDEASSLGLSCCFSYDRQKWCWIREERTFLARDKVLNIIKDLKYK